MPGLAKPMSRASSWLKVIIVFCTVYMIPIWVKITVLAMANK